MPVQFHVDPDFYDHPKTAGMSDSAFSLWVRAGSYSACHGTSGFIARVVLAETLRVPASTADELVRHGLWRRCRGGYQFEPIGWFIPSSKWRPWIPTWLRTVVMERDGYRCLECGSTKRLSLDHIQPWSKGGLDTEENLQSFVFPAMAAGGLVFK